MKETGVKVNLHSVLGGEGWWYNVHTSYVLPTITLVVQSGLHRCPLQADLGSEQTASRNDNDRSRHAEIFEGSCSGERTTPDSIGVEPKHMYMFA